MLSGSSSDGAKGLKNIAEMNGSTFVQNPSDAESPFMPLAAINLYANHSILDIKTWPQ